jgi:hypothetical protein
VAVDEPGDDRQARAVDHVGARPDVLAHLRVLADRDEPAVAPGEGGRVRLPWVERADPGAENGAVGAEGHARILPRAPGVGQLGAS